MCEKEIRGGRARRAPELLFALLWALWVLKHSPESSAGQCHSSEQASGIDLLVNDASDRILLLLKVLFPLIPGISVCSALR